MPNPEPFLMVDLGDDFAPGHSANVEFKLLCPGYSGRPVVTARLDHLLDQTKWLPQSQTHQDAHGHWEFGQSFELRGEGGTECAPGSYRIEIAVEFPAVPSQETPRFLRAAFRFHVPEKRRDDIPRVLEIEGEGMSIIDASNIAALGANFDNVRLKGSGTSIVSLAGKPTAAAAPLPAASRTFVQPLLPDQDRMHESPFASSRPRPAKSRDRLMLQCLETGRRTLLLAQLTVRLGRDPEKSDICLGLFPMQTRDALAKTELISTRHLSFDLRRAGVELCELNSRNGTTVNGRRLTPNAPFVLTASKRTAELKVATVLLLQVEFVPGLPALDAYRGDAPGSSITECDPHSRVTGASRWSSLDHPDLTFSDRLTSADHASPDRRHAVAVGLTTEPELWKRAELAEVDALRIRRLKHLANEEEKHLANEEEYVVLYRQATIGPTERSTVKLTSDVAINDVARLFHACGIFWFEALTPDLTITVDDHSPALRELVPLEPGMRLQLGSNTLQVMEWKQELTIAEEFLK